VTRENVSACPATSSAIESEMLQVAQKHNASQTDLAFQRCINPACGATYDAQSVRTSCDRCGDLLDIAYDWDRAGVPEWRSLW